MQKACFKLGKANTGGLHNTFFNVKKNSPLQWPKCQGISHYNKEDKGAEIFENYYINQL